jgi:hypothetical protein
MDQLPQQFALVTGVVRCHIGCDLRVSAKIEQNATGWRPWFAILTGVSNPGLLGEKVDRHVTAPYMVWSVNPE